MYIAVKPIVINRDISHKYPAVKLEHLSQVKCTAVKPIVINRNTSHKYTAVKPIVINRNTSHKYTAVTPSVVKWKCCYGTQ